MEVRKIMTKNPASCTADSTLQEVAHMMEMYDCGCIPVVESHKNNKPIGTITDRDIAIRSLAENKNPLDMKASDIMTTDIATVTPETSVEQCRDRMEDRQIRRILVVDKTGRCVGIVAQADIAQHEVNPRQTAEFIRDVSQPSHSSQHSEYRGFSSDRDNDMSSERESYRNFSNQNRDYDFSMNQERQTRSHSKPKQGKRFKKTRTEEKSFFSSGYMLPLLIGVSVGAAWKYFSPTEEKRQTTFVPRERVTSTVHTTTETTPKVSVKLPTDTQIHANDMRDTTTGRTGTSPLDRTSTLDADKDDSTSEIGRTARL